MASKTHTDMDFATTVKQLGGAERLEAEARETRAFLQPREVKAAVDLARRWSWPTCMGPPRVKRFVWGSLHFLQVRFFVRFGIPFLRPDP